MNLNDVDITDIVGVCGPKLKHIDVGDTLCTDKGLLSIAKNCPNLEIIGLRNLPIVEEGIFLLCQNASNIKSIDMGGCYETTDNAIAAIAKLTGLVEINLEGLYLISEASIKELVDNCKHINRIEIPENPTLITQSFRLNTINGREWRGKKPNQVTGYN